MKTKKMIALMLALVFAFVNILPMTAFAEPLTKNDVLGKLTADDVQTDEPSETELIVHKLVADSYKEGVPLDHNGGLLDKDTLNKIGTSVRELDGVTFTYFKVEGEKHFKEMLAHPENYKTKEAVKDFLGKAHDSEEAQTTDTDGTDLGPTADGKGVSHKFAKGNYWFVESDRPARVTEGKAVPFGISLPLLNQVKVDKYAPGSVYMKKVHVYPKNLEKKPQMDKGFAKENADNEGVDSQMLKAWQDKYGPVYNDYLNEKTKIDARIGSKVPYEVKTKLQAGQIYKTLSWSDMMTKGLKYNNDVKVTYKTTENDNISIEEAKLIKTENSGLGFDLQIKDDATIKAINKALTKGDVEITLTYTATVTMDAVVDSPENNNITFNPADPKHNEKFTTPGQTSLTVTKSWATGEVPEKKPLVTYMLIEKDETSGSKRVVASVSTKGDNKLLAESYTGNIKATANGYDVTFTGLDTTKVYTVEEFADGYDPEYTGATTLKNTENPDRVTPTPPQVVVGGKKFVKTDQSNNRLAGAEFKVTNEAGDKYLVAKSDGNIAMNQKAVTDAKKTLDELIEQYNNLSAEAQKTSDLKDQIKKQQGVYNDAVRKAGTIYEWGNASDAITFVSNADGQFEVTGLAYGNYKLVETNPPKGFGRLTNPQPFTINAESYTKNGDISYELEGGEEDTQKDAQKVENKKLTIPQTGGMGTVLFTLIGLALMGGAVFAMRRRNQEEA